MYAMQYRVGLPADYDMGIIRERVATKGHLLDRHPGLGLKAYLVTEAGKAGALVNQYAPFYLWTDVRRMGDFLWGGEGFQGIVASFGRPPVSHWTGVTFCTGPAVSSTPRAATLESGSIAPHQDPREAVAQARETCREHASAKGVHCTALAVDPSRWQMVRLTLWEDHPNGRGERFTVLHTSTPHITDLSVLPG